MDRIREARRSAAAAAQGTLEASLSSYRMVSDLLAFWRHAMIRALALSSVAISFLGLFACGPTCQNTCSRVYNDCGITKTGQTRDELLDRCEDECSGALKNAGDQGEYNPLTPRQSAESLVLENEEQAAAWMDCVWEKVPNASPEECQSLDAGFCAPI